MMLGVSRQTLSKELQALAREGAVELGYGKIAIGHSELNGHQSATGAIAQGRRIAEQAAT